MKKRVKKVTKLRKKMKQNNLSDFAKRIAGQSMFQILEKAKDLEGQGKSLVHFEIGDSHLEMPQEVKDSAINALKSNRTHYSVSYGELSLRTAIQKTVNEDLGFKPALAQIVVGSGANPFIFYLLAALVNPGEEVILADPTFVTYHAVLSMLKIKGRSVPVNHKNNFRFNPEEISRSITKKTRVIIINSPANPTGAVYSKSDITKIYQLAKKHNLYIISDEIYSHLVYEGKHFSVGTKDKCLERVIVTNGFSKPFAMTGWRVGYAIGPEKIMEKIALLSQTIVSCVPPFLQDACIIALKHRHKFAKRYFTEYKKLRDIACEKLGGVKQFSFAKPKGAFYLMLDVSRTGMNGDEFAKHAMNFGVVVCPGSGFGSEGKNYIRICYANSKSNLLEGCHRLRQAAENVYNCNITK
jgi:aspartate aminotransferase